MLLTRANIMAVHNPKTIADYGKHLIEILPLKTVTVPPYTTTNAVFFGLNRFYVIDPGSSEASQQSLLKTYVHERHKNGGKLLGICLTHHHGDHMKAAEFLAEEYFVPIFAHAHAQQFLKFKFSPIKNNQIFAHDHEPTLRAIYTPGHSDDHIAYYAENEGVLIAGDMITDRGTTLIPPQGGSLRVYLDSLEQLTELNLRIVIPAHGEVIRNEPKKFLIFALKHRLARIKAVLDALKNKDELDATDITRIVYHNSIAENLMLFAQLSVESSLQWLKENGLVDNPNHLWRVCNDDTNRIESVLLDRIKQIEQRLRNT